MIITKVVLSNLDFLIVTSIGKSGLSESSEEFTKITATIKSAITDIENKKNRQHPAIRVLTITDFVINFSDILRMLVLATACFPLLTQ